MSNYVPRHSRLNEGLPEKKPLESQEKPSSPPKTAKEQASSPLAGSSPFVTTEEADLPPKNSVEASSPLKSLDLFFENDEASNQIMDNGDNLSVSMDNGETFSLSTDSGENLRPTAESALAKMRKRRWPVTIAVLLVLIVGGGAITYAVLSSQAIEREASRTAGYALLDESIALIQESDQVVVNLDTATTNEVTEANLSEREVLLERVPTTLETLESAEEKAQEALALLIAENDKEFAQHVIEAATNRKDMLTSGKAIIVKDIEAMKSALLFGQAWQLILSADTEFRATTELSKTGGYSELLEAVQRNNALLATFQTMSDLLVQAQDAFESADYSVVAEYVALKKESVQLAIAADQALLEGDLETVNSKNAEFVLKDAGVVAAAGKIPSEPFTIITDAYATATAEDHALYTSARANAANADGYVREYVGVETQTGVQ